MTDDEKDRALCEAHCNSAADEYFNARPQLDSNVNRRIFYAGHRKAWVERGEAVRLNAQAVPVGVIKRAIEALTYCEALNRNIEHQKLRSLNELHNILSAAPAAPQPVQQADKLVMCGYGDGGYACCEGGPCAAELHNNSVLQTAQQPLTDEKDALLRQALEALEGFVHITNDSQGVAGYHLSGDTAEWDEFDEVDAASNTIEAIRNHLGVKND